MPIKAEPGQKLKNLRPFLSSLKTFRDGGINLSSYSVSGSIRDLGS